MWTGSTLRTRVPRFTTFNPPDAEVPKPCKPLRRGKGSGERNCTLHKVPIDAEVPRHEAAQEGGRRVTLRSLCTVPTKKSDYVFQMMPNIGRKNVLWFWCCQGNSRPVDSSRQGSRKLLRQKGPPPSRSHKYQKASKRRQFARAAPALCSAASGNSDFGTPAQKSQRKKRMLRMSIQAENN